MLLIDRNSLIALNKKTLDKYKKTTFSIALLLCACGFLCLLSPIYAGVALSYLTGILLTICGIYSILCAYTFRSSGKTTIFYSLTLGVIYVVMGVGVFMSPLIGIKILSLTICFLFMLAGISRLSVVFRKPTMIGHYLYLLIGITDLVIAFFWVNENESTTYILTSVFIGLKMISSSCAYFMLRNIFGQRLKKTEVNAH